MLTRQALGFFIKTSAHTHMTSVQLAQGARAGRRLSFVHLHSIRVTGGFISRRTQDHIAGEWPLVSGGFSRERDILPASMGFVDQGLARRP